MVSAGLLEMCMFGSSRNERPTTRFTPDVFRCLSAMIVKRVLRYKESITDSAFIFGAIVGKITDPSS